MKNKKGKKLVVLGAMAALLTLIGVSGSQTYAKYVETTTVPSQSATVAKWGYVVSTEAQDLFGKDYKVEGVNDSLAELNVTANGSYTTVKAFNNNQNNIVAPGTKGSMTVDVDGAAEVDAQLTFTHLDNSISEIHLDTYYPLVWSYTITGVPGGDLSSDANAQTKTLASVLDELANVAIVFDAGSTVDLQLTLSWEWAFSNGHDVEDTKLAILSNGENGDSIQYRYDDYEVDGQPVQGLASQYAGKFGVSTSFEFNVNLEQVQK